VGMRESVMRTVTASTVTLFAEVSGDVNPIHLSDDYAAQTRFGQRIAHGMFTASLISAVIGTRLPGAGAVYLSQTLRFLAPVRIGDVVAAIVEVAEMVEKGRRVRLDCQCLVDGQPVLEGEAWVTVPGAARAG
jgi:3-hydroxybutyryl-CoA dehydratase